jgi:hypothetical protein
MSDTFSWMFIFLLIFNITERFATSISDLVALTNLLTIIVVIIWGISQFRINNKEAKK